MPQILVALVALATLSAWVPAQAAPMNRPQAEYSADSTIQNEEGTIQQQSVRHADQRAQGNTDRLRRWSGSDFPVRQPSHVDAHAVRKDVHGTFDRQEVRPKEMIRLNGPMKILRWEKKR